MLNTVSTLTGSAVFSIIYVLSLLLLTTYLNRLYSIGKCEIWPLILLLTVGEIVKGFFITAKRESLSKKNNRLYKSKNTKLKLRDYIKSSTILVVLLFVYYIIAVLFGAPIFSEQEETFMFSLLLTVLTILPLLLVLGPDLTVTVLTSITAYEGDPLSQIMIVCVRLTLFGAWLGAVVIPLDWDRPWQVWPIPCSLGAILGYIVSQCFILLLNMPKIAALMSKKTGKYGL